MFWSLYSSLTVVRAGSADVSISIWCTAIGLLGLLIGVTLGPNAVLFEGPAFGPGECRGVLYSLFWLNSNSHEDLLDQHEYPKNDLGEWGFLYHPTMVTHLYYGNILGDLEVQWYLCDQSWISYIDMYFVVYMYVYVNMYTTHKITTICVDTQ